MRDVLLKRADYIPEQERDEYLRFVTRFQQTTSPVTAKGIEDTAFYVYNRLVSLNEVGGEPARFGVSPGDLHGWLAERQRQWPSALSATSTHDTKRSEDVRARISVLSEIPGAWQAGARPLVALEQAAPHDGQTDTPRRIATRSTCSTRRCSAPGRSRRSAATPARSSSRASAST